MTQDQMSRAVVSVLGADRPGIVAEIAHILADHHANILDISQTILQGLFTMTMFVELNASTDFQVVNQAFDELSRTLGIQIRFQREEVFRYMNRI